MVRCPVNADHVVPEESLTKHSEACRLVQEGYSRQQQVSPNLHVEMSTCTGKVLISIPGESLAKQSEECRLVQERYSNQHPVSPY